VLGDDAKVVECLDTFAMRRNDCYLSSSSTECLSWFCQLDLLHTIGRKDGNMICVVAFLFRHRIHRCLPFLILSACIIWNAVRSRASACTHPRLSVLAWCPAPHRLDRRDST